MGGYGRRVQRTDTCSQEVPQDDRVARATKFLDNAATQPRLQHQDAPCTNLVLILAVMHLADLTVISSCIWNVEWSYLNPTVA